MQIDMIEKVKVDAKVLRVHLKVTDRFCATLESSSNKELKAYEGGVPGFMPGEHDGDYVILDIDIDTGQILNWSPPSAEEIEKFISADDD